MEVWSLVVIIDKEFQNAKRNRWFLLTSIIYAGLSLALSLLGFSGIGTMGVTGFGRTAASLVNLILLIVPLMGLLLGTMSLAHERERGTLRTLLAQPVTASEILLGKFFGSSAALALTVLLGFSLSGFLIGISGGMAQISHYLMLLLFTLLLGFVYLGLGFLISVFVSSSMAAVGWALFLWFLMIFASDLAMIGTSIAFKLTPPQLVGLAFLNPSQIFKMAMMGTLQGDMENLGAAGRYLLDQFGNGFLAMLTGLLIAWILAPLTAAMYLFQRRRGL